MAYCTCDERNWPMPDTSTVQIAAIFPHPGLVLLTVLYASWLVLTNVCANISHLRYIFNVILYIQKLHQIQLLFTMISKKYSCMPISHFQWWQLPSMWANYLLLCIVVESMGPHAELPLVIFNYSTSICMGRGKAKQGMEHGPPNREFLDPPLNVCHRYKCYTNTAYQSIFDVGNIPVTVY